MAPTEIERHDSSFADEKKLSHEHLEHHDDPETLKPVNGVEPKKKGANTQLDDAARLLQEAGGSVEYTPEENKRVLRMIDLYVCVPMCIVYWIQQLDKSSVSYAAVFDLQTETNLKGTQYSWLTSAVYLAQLICQPLSSYALIVFPVKYWVMANFTAWSIVTACTGAATNFTGLLICRILLGAFEATILPSFILITQMWWTRREQSYRTIAWQVANSMAAILGPLLSYGVGHVKGTVKPYQGIFIFMGCFSLAMSTVVWWLLPNSPITAKFLRGGQDRLVAVERLRENNTGTKSSTFKAYQVRETFKDPKTWLWFLMYVCCATPSGGFGAFGGLITKGLGFNKFESILMQMPTGALQIVTLLVGIWITNKYKKRWPVIAFLCIPPIAGASGLLKVSRDRPHDLLGCYYVAMLLGALQPLLYTWANLNAAGSTKRVTTTAIMFVGQCVGNIIGPQVYLAREAPKYFTGLKVDIACWAALFCLVLTQAAYLTYLNKKKEQQRAALGLPTDLKDISLMSTDEATAYRIELKEILSAKGFDENKLNDSAFEDQTDWESIHFRYVI